MNERIKQLAEQAWNMVEDTNRPLLFAEKFAELIVRECCLVLEQTQDALDPQKWPTPRGCTEYIKDHFGVES